MPTTRRVARVHVAAATALLLLGGLAFAATRVARAASGTAPAWPGEGQILLDVQRNGEAWYFQPGLRDKHYLADGNAAYSALRTLSLGVGTADLKTIPVGIIDAVEKTDVDTDGDGLGDKLEDALGTDKTKVDTDGDGYPDGTEVRGGFDAAGTGKLPSDPALLGRVKGDILLQVMDHGEAWYVNPKDGKRYYLRDGNAAYQIMRTLGTGATSATIDQAGQSNVQADCGTNLKCFADSTANGQPAFVHTTIKAVAPDGSVADSDQLLETSLDYKTHEVEFDNTSLATGAATHCDFVDRAKLAAVAKDWQQGKVDVKLAGSQPAGDYARLGNCQIATEEKAEQLHIRGDRAQVFGTAAADKTEGGQSLRPEDQGAALRGEMTTPAPPIAAAPKAPASPAPPIAPARVKPTDAQRQQASRNCGTDLACFTAAVAAFAPATASPAFTAGLSAARLDGTYDLRAAYEGDDYVFSLATKTLAVSADANPNAQTDDLTQAFIQLAGYTEKSILEAVTLQAELDAHDTVSCRDVDAGPFAGAITKAFAETSSLPAADLGVETRAATCTGSPAQAAIPKWDLATRDCGDDYGCLTNSFAYLVPGKYAKTVGAGSVSADYLVAPTRDHFTLNYLLTGAQNNDGNSSYSFSCDLYPATSGAVARVLAHSENAVALRLEDMSDAATGAGATQDNPTLSPDALNSAKRLHDALQPLCGARVAPTPDLAAAGQPHAASARENDSKRVADIRLIQTALELYWMDHNSYPGAAGDGPLTLGAGGTSKLCGSGWEVLGDGCEKTYMNKIDPAPPADGMCSAADNDYTYTFVSKDDYSLTFCLSDKVGDHAGGKRTANAAGIK